MTLHLRFHVSHKLFNTVNNFVYSLDSIGNISETSKSVDLIDTIDLSELDSDCQCWQDEKMPQVSVMITLAVHGEQLFVLKFTMIHLYVRNLEDFLK